MSTPNNNNDNNASRNSMSLNDSVSSITQNMNQGMGAVGDTAADIEIYMGEQSNEMGKTAGTGLGGAMQQQQPPSLNDAKASSPQDSK